LNIVKPLIIVTFVFVAPLSAFAQNDTANRAPVTHAAVEAQLTSLEAVGFNPWKKDNAYPAAIQTAEAKRAQQQTGAPTRTATAH